ncbi:MAG TPA: RluA family pseudouridine synthase [Candidatus Polarisedimenticolaceae bacterium]
MNRGFTFRERVAVDAAGASLLDHLAARYPHSDRETWRRRIAEGSVSVDGDPDEPLRAGQLVVWHRPGWEEPEAPTGFDVLFEDDSLLAVGKPSGLPTLPGGGFLENTLLYAVRARTPGASPLHRLGRFTSGIVLFAKDAATHRALSAQWRRREVVKRYRALASGRSVEDRFVVDVPIGPVPHPLHGTVFAASPAGKPALTRVQVVRRDDDAFLADVFIETGRPHQIRIHLAAAGHPLVGDPLYGPGGGPIPGSTARVGDGGYRLHAAELRFRHPANGVEVVVRSEPPRDLR